jgi:hypothetical protein
MVDVHSDGDRPMTAELEHEPDTNEVIEHGVRHVMLEAEAAR